MKIRSVFLFNRVSSGSDSIPVLIRSSARSLPRGYYFFLDKKVAKNQDGKNLLPARPTPGPVFRQAFALI